MEGKLDNVLLFFVWKDCKVKHQMYHSFFSAFVNAKYSGGPCHLRLANTWKLPFRIADFIPTSLVESHPVSTLLFFINNQNFEISPKLLNRLTKVTSKYCLLIVSFSSLIFAHFIRIRYPSLLFVLYLIQTSWTPRHLNLTTFFISHDFSAKRCPANIRLGEDVLKMSWRRLENILGRRIANTSWRRLQDDFKRSWKTKSVTLKTASRRLEDVLENKKCLVG